PIQFANVMGGDLWAQYLDQQIPFVGVGNSAFRRNCLAIARLDARLRLGKNNYITLMGNVGYDFVEFKEFTGGEIVSGAGLSYAYNSIFGPLKFQVHWSSLTQTVGVYLSFGYNF
ncbi:MAG: patatin, partial [Bacteroidales bacterium]|nr:patatin [Bacteroidales bacterium]